MSWDYIDTIPGAPTGEPGNVGWGPDFGEGAGSDGKTFGVGVSNPSMPSLALSGGPTIGVQPRLLSLVLPFDAAAGPKLGVKTALPAIALPFESLLGPKVGVQTKIGSLILPFDSERSPKVGVKTALADVKFNAVAANPQLGVRVAGTALGAPLVLGITTNFTTNAPTSFTIPKGGAQVGELLLVNVMGSGGTPGTNVIVPSETGWNQIDQGLSGAAGNQAPRMGTWWRIVAAGDPDNYTFTTSAGNAYNWGGGALRIIGFDSVTPIDVFAVTTASATDPVAPSITTTVANTRKLAFASMNTALNQTMGPPPNYVGTWDLDPSNVGIVTGTMGGAHRAQATAGASGTATFNSDTALANNYRAVHIAIRPGPFQMAA